MTYKPTAEHSRILSHDPGAPAERPWQQGTANCADGHAICSGPSVVAVVLGNGYPIGKGWAPDSHASAALIVRAVNAYDALLHVVSFAERLNAIQHSGATITADEWSELHQLCNAARGAIEESA